MRRKGLWLSVLATAVIAGSASADVSGIGPSVPNGLVTGININDGNLSDWGVSTPGSTVDFTNATNPWVPSKGGYAYEDTVIGTFVGPQHGGQDFDAEAMYTGYDNTNHTLYVALVTGFDLTGQLVGGTNYLPGDIFIDFGTYFPQNGQNPENNINITSTGTAKPYVNTGHTWDLDISLQGVTGDGVLNAVTGFGIDYTPALGHAGSNSGPFKPKATQPGTSAGTASFNYTANFGSSQRNLYEFSYVLDPNNALQNSWLNQLLLNDSGNYGWTVHWTMSCGNDYLDAASYLDKGTPLVPLVPVPAAAPLAMLGMAIVGIARRKRQVK